MGHLPAGFHSPPRAQWVYARAGDRISRARPGRARSACVRDYGRFPYTGWLALLCFWTGRVPRRRLTVGRDENKARFSRDRSAAASSHGEGGGHYEVLFASK